MKFGILLIATAAATLVTGACRTTPNSVAAASQAPIPTTVGPIPGGVSEAKPRMNPYTGNAVALQEGLRLFNWYNCSGCHGGHAGGGMGPSLRDEVWIYGNRDDQIFDSIVAGPLQRYAGLGNEDSRRPDLATGCLHQIHANAGGARAAR